MIRDRSQPEPSTWPGVSRAGLIAVGVLVTVAVVLVGLSLRQPDVPEYPPTPAEGSGEVGTGPRILTVDASDPDRWRYVNLARGTVAGGPFGYRVGSGVPPLRSARKRGGWVPGGRRRVGLGRRPA